MTITASLFTQISWATGTPGFWPAGSRCPTRRTLFLLWLGLRRFGRVAVGLVVARRRGVAVLLVRELHLVGVVVLDVRPRILRVVLGLLDALRRVGHVAGPRRERTLERPARQLRWIPIDVARDHRG